MASAFADPGTRSSCRFSRYIGIDYSGAGWPEARNSGLAVYEAPADGAPRRVLPDGGGRWSRVSLASWLERSLDAGAAGPVLAGIDHGFSFPDAYFRRYGLTNWRQFLEDFVRHWPCDRSGVKVEDRRRSNPRCGEAHWLRLAESWTPSAKSVFRFDQQGSVAKSTHAGLPWLRRLALMDGVHIWPFDGFRPVPGAHLVAEVYPALFHRRYRAPDGLGSHERDAWSVCRWLQATDRNGFLDRYLEPPLTTYEQELVHRREGWILGVA